MARKMFIPAATHKMMQEDKAEYLANQKRIQDADGTSKYRASAEETAKAARGDYER